MRSLSGSGTRRRFTKSWWRALSTLTRAECQEVLICSQREGCIHRNIENFSCMREYDLVGCIDEGAIGGNWAMHKIIKMP